MHEPSASRKRTLALQERALRFSDGVNAACPQSFSNVPSRTVWEQLVKAADSTSNNLIEADAASSDADFLSKMSIALREAKESRAALMKIRMGRLDHAEQTMKRDLESEADQLAAIFATIIRNMRMRLAREEAARSKKTSKKT
jgi:four helix bundle protein